MRGDDGSLEDMRGLVDSYSDISNYGVVKQVGVQVVNGVEIKLQSILTMG